MNISLHKVITAISKIKISILTTLVSFIASFNLWFLSIYFLKSTFLVHHGLTITLMTTFALTTTWYLFSAIIVPKDFLLYCFAFNDFDESDGSNDESFNFFIFSETIISHSLFFYLAYYFKWSFFSFVSITFFSIGLRYILTDIFLKIFYHSYRSRRKLGEKINAILDQEEPTLINNTGVDENKN